MELDPAESLAPADEPDLAVLDLGRSTKTSELAARRLARWIIDEGIQVGTPLPPEKQMAERLGIGRGSMREALRMLET